MGLVEWYGEPFQVWEMWPSCHSEKPVGSEVGQAGPAPMDKVLPWGIRPPVYLDGYEACFLLKLPHPELRQQVFTAYL